MAASRDPETRAILHLDMDAFYASVEVLDNPELAGKPVIVGGVGLRGVVSAASYEARVFGVHSAQPISQARRLCPQAVFLPVRMGRYQAVSRRIFEIFARYSPLVEPLSLDEAFLDVTGSLRLFGPPEDLARRIKDLVKQEIGLTVSAGVASTKFVAKIASDFQKPDGLTIVPADGVLDFLHPLPISRLWGVGRVTRRALEMLGVETIGDLARLPTDLLAKKFGVGGRHLSELARGIDARPVEPMREVKSIGAEETLMRDILDPVEARREILRLAVRVARRLRAKGFLTQRVTLKVKYGDFKMVTRSETLGARTDASKPLYQAACRLLESTEVGQRPVRLLGISLSGLTTEEDVLQIRLFDDLSPNAKEQDLDRALDRIADRFGDRAVIPASLLKSE